eukprot:3521294-Rhodomonas_salina.1
MRACSEPRGSERARASDKEKREGWRTGKGRGRGKRRAGRSEGRAAEEARRSRGLGKRARTHAPSQHNPQTTQQ